jgi:UDP-N-acetylglucosamine 2-epimerase
MLKVLSIVGTRPEAIKMAPVVLELGEHPDRVVSVVCSTGQHRGLLSGALELFGIEPDFDLSVMRKDQLLSALTARLFEALDPVVREVRPDWVLAQGDTTTVLVASLVALYQRVRFGHVEAGLRTGDLHQPFPEEANRRIADAMADLMFAPTEASRAALLREGRPAERILVTGNTGVDALRIATERADECLAGALAEIPQAKRLVLITAHRRESFGGPLRELCLAIRDLAKCFAEADVHFVWPVHPNPNVEGPVRSILGGSDAVHLVEPLDFFSLVQVLTRATLVLTDSGGIQEEASSLGVPVLVMRDKTDRPESEDAGVARLVGTQRQRIFAEVRRLLGDDEARRAMTTCENLYGDGFAARRIAAALLAES